MNTKNLPRFCYNKQTGQLEEVRLQSEAVIPNPEWRSPKEGEVIGLR